MPRPLPNVTSLRDAVICVIESNIADKYQPKRFILMTEYGDSANLFEVCRSLINNAEVLEWLEKAVKQHPTLLTIEDFVQRRGIEWGFDAATIANARGRAEYFNTLSRGKRYDP